MKLYEIDQRILNLIDPETGEIIDMQAMMDLQMAREDKLESLALYYKDLAAEAKALKEEQAVLHERQKTTEAKAERLKLFLSEQLAGQKFKTSKVAVSFRSSEAVVCDDEFVAWAHDNKADDLLTYKPATPNLKNIKEAIKAGKEIAHAEIEHRSSISIK